MDSKLPCRCCRERHPNKNLKTAYLHLGQNEIYAEMLKDCFGIHLNIDAEKGDSGICDTCIARLRDAHDFKAQVLHCQTEFLENLDQVATVKDEIIKTEIEILELDDDWDQHDLNFGEVKEEMRDTIDPDKGSRLAEQLGMRDISIKWRGTGAKDGQKPWASKVEEKPQIEIRKAGSKGGSDAVDRKLTELLGLRGTSVKRSDQRQRQRNRRAENSGRKSKMIKISLSPSQLSQLNREKENPLDPYKPLLWSSKSERQKRCYNHSMILKYSNCTPFLNLTMLGIFCIHCKKTFAGIKELRIHMADAHKNQEIPNEQYDKSRGMKMDITDLKCNICQVDIDVISNLKKHLTTEHDIKIYSDVLDLIVEFKLTESEMFHCALCNYPYETFKMLIQHMNGHYKNYICDVCDRGFIHNNALHSHKKRHEDGNYKCTICDKVFASRDKQLKHERCTHSETKFTRKCPHCNESFKEYSQRNKHILEEHNIKVATYRCNICDKSFFMKSLLTNHVRRYHLLERNHICSECQQGFYDKRALIEHKVKHSGEKTFVCNVCSKSYCRLKTLREHMRIHNNDRRFKCGVCDMTFVQKCSMKSHMLTNHGVTYDDFIAMNESGPLP